MQTKKEQLIEAMKAELAAARAITVPVDNAGREYTPAEQAAVRNHLAKSEQIKVQLDALKDDERIKAAIADLGNGIGVGVGSKDAPKPAWATKGRGHSEWASSTADRLLKAKRATGAKALVTGSVDVEQVIRPDIVRLPSTPTRIIDLLVQRRAISDNGFSFLRQSVRTNNAAPVADSALKPTSVYTFGEITDKVHVIAHLSEKIPERFVDDHSQISRFLESEMEDGLLRAVEAQVIAGSGTGENMRGITNTSGTLVQAWNTNLFTTARKAVTQMRNLGEVPNAWAVHPNDVETIDLLQDDIARHYYRGPQEAISDNNPLWSLPIVQSTSVPAGTGILGDWNYVELIVRQDSRFDIDRSGDLFTHNELLMRVEGRYGCAVLRPSAFAEVALVAP